MTGVDPSPVLVDIARSRTRQARVNAEILVGDAAALPVADGSFDVVVSVFAVIFASNPRAAAAGLVRAARPGATVAVTTWNEEGPIAAAGRVVRGTLARSEAASARSPVRLGWDTLLAEAGLRDVTTTAAALAFTATSPQAWFDEQEQHHARLPGAGATDLAAWTLSTVIGVLLGGVLGEPAALGLDAAYPALFVWLLRDHLGPMALLGGALALALTPLLAPGLPVVVAGLAAGAIGAAR